MEDILREIPHSFETRRLTIRCPQPGDGPELHAAIMESLIELRPWLNWATDTLTVEKCEARTRKAYIKFLAREELRWLLFLKGTQRLIGGSGLHYINWSVPKFEISYWVRTYYARQGYITEAVDGITNFAFNVLDAKRIEIRCDPRNERSIAVAHRLGFEYEGTLRSDNRDHLTDKLVDTMIFAIIKQD